MCRYKVSTEPVGRGGFGKVHPGVDTVLNRQIAVKSLDPVWAAANLEDKERFKREAKILASLSHPNIPAIYDVVFQEDALSIVFQYIEGRTLREILDGDDTISMASCQSWFDQLASALDHAHKKGIIHRDIKPENIIVSPDLKHCHLVDFGIALSKAEIERLTGSDQWIGTRGYMSPEQERGDELDPSDDLYVLGAVLYETLSRHRIDIGEYNPLNLTNELIPPAIDELILKCIAPKPRRPKSAEEFRRVLRDSVRLHRSFSETLSSGPLHEIVQAIWQMSPSQFMELKLGQRLLILQRCADVVANRTPRLAAARTEFLAVMAPLGIHLDPEDYKKIIDPAIRLAFGDEPCPTRAKNQIRDSLTEAASVVGQPNHGVIVNSLVEWLQDIVIDSQRPEVHHSLRQLLSALLANPECVDTDATSLAKVLRGVNDSQRSQAAARESEPLFADPEPAYTDSPNH